MVVTGSSMVVAVRSTALARGSMIITVRSKVGDGRSKVVGGGSMVVTILCIGVIAMSIAAALLSNAVTVTFMLVDVGNNAVTAGSIWVALRASVVAVVFMQKVRRIMAGMARYRTIAVMSPVIAARFATFYGLPRTFGAFPSRPRSARKSGRGLPQSKFMPLPFVQKPCAAGCAAFTARLFLLEVPMTGN